MTGYAHGVEAIRFVRGSHGQAFLDRDRYNYRETWKNLSTGERFKVSGHGLFEEISAKFVPNEDVPADLVPPEGLYALALESRQQSRTDMGGKRPSRDSPAHHACEHVGHTHE